MDSIDKLIPEWASGRASDYMEIGAALPTRDGRRCGNATVLQKMNDDLALVRTDAGTEMRLSRKELEELFWPPEFVQRDPDWRPV